MRNEPILHMYAVHMCVAIVGLGIIKSLEEAECSKSELLLYFCSM